jgi:hypothetical protein
MPPLPPSASMACRGTALLLLLQTKYLVLVCDYFSPKGESSRTDGTDFIERVFRKVVELFSFHLDRTIYLPLCTEQILTYVD